MPYTFAPAPVLVETTGEFAIGATGTFRDANGDVVPVFDLNMSPLPGVLVGPKGAHQAFRTVDTPNGILDFDSVLLPKLSDEAKVAALELRALVDAFIADGGGSGGIVFAGSNVNTARPETTNPLLWLCTGDPANADDTKDVVLFITSAAVGETIDGALVTESGDVLVTESGDVLTF